MLSVSLFLFYIDFLNKNYCGYIRMAVKMKKESSYSFAEKEYVSHVSKR